MKAYSIYVSDKQYQCQSVIICSKLHHNYKLKRPEPLVQLRVHEFFILSLWWELQPTIINTI